MTTPERIQDAIGRVKDQRSFIQEMLVEALDWAVDPDAESLDDISYGWSLDDLRAEGIDERLASGEVWQIRPMAARQPWGVFLLEFKEPEAVDTGRGMTGLLRKVLRGLVASRRKHSDLPSWKRENLLFICTHQYRQFRFAYFKAPAGDTKSAPLASFGWAQGDSYVRTLCEHNLPALAFPEDQGRDPEAWVAQWAGAFDVEKVTKRFFAEYRDVFERMEASVQGVRKDGVRMYTQRLLNRLMFLYFIQKKGWLRFEGRADYLRALFDAAERGGEDFLNDRLYWLFFNGLNQERDKLCESDRRALVAKCGEVPYLNGGLFNVADNHDAQGAVRIPNAAFAVILALFERYNFTVTESTPLDIEVAVDPEMLGKVFEELVTGRHESGSYYTPRPVVAFMCREALKGHLQTAIAAAPDAVELLVDEKDASKLNVRQAREAVAALDALKAVDPACGSGAYLLGLLREMIEIYQALFSERLARDSRSVCDLKLRVITRSIYGVDIDDFAVQIARLRLWLSLAVDSDDPLPLPNLEFKIECGDSLTAPDPGRGRNVNIFRVQLIERFDKLKTEYLQTRDVDRRAELMGEIDDIRRSLRERTAEQTRGFDWRVEFAEVFAPSDRPAPSGGFDIVLANPPYVRQELIRSLKPMLKDIYSASVYAGTADLYCYFYARAVQLLRPGGMMGFISSNKWFKAAYGKKLRAYVSERCHVRGITDFGDLPVFESATAYPMIFVAQKKLRDAQAEKGCPAPPVLTQPKSLGPPYPNVRGVVDTLGREMGPSALNGEEWSFADKATAQRIAAMRKSGIPLREYVKGKVYRGILTGYNKAFVIDGETRAALIAEDAASAEIIKPLAMGRDVKKWRIERKDRYLIFTRRGVNIEDYKAVKRYLARYRERLEPRPKEWPSQQKWGGRKPGQYKWYEMQDTVAYYEEFEKPKIVFPDIAPQPRFAFDTRNHYLGNTGYIIPVNDLFLLGVLNSRHVEQFYEDISSRVRGGYFRFIYQYVAQIPIPKASKANKVRLQTLVEKCLDAHGVGCEAWEQEIDERVARLYGLDAKTPGAQ